jgi:hypothetical protein
LVTESGDNARDDFSVPVLTDQHMRTRSTIPEWDHQLLRMPESQNDVAPLPIKRVHLFMTLLVKTHSPSDPTDDEGTERRKHGEFQPCRESAHRYIKHL